MLPGLRQTLVRLIYCKRPAVEKEYYSYRCRNRYTATRDFRKTIAEKKTERHLLKYLDKYLEKEIANVELKATQPKPKPKVNINTLREKLPRRRA